MAYPNDFQPFAVAGTLTPSLGSPGLPAVTMPSSERLTLQREANDLLEQLGRAHAIMDQFSPVPSPSSPGVSAVVLPLGQSLTACREQMARLVERIDGLFAVIGQI